MDFNCQLRVLIMDTDTARRDQLAEQLWQHNLTVYTADASMPDVAAAAADRVIALRCHAVVLVPDLVAAFNDPAGYLESLTRRFEAARLVIYTPEADDRLAFQAGRLGMEYVRHNDPISELVAAVEAQGRQGCQCQLSITWSLPPEDFVYYMTQQLKQDADNITLEQLYDLMGRSFNQAQQLTLRPLLSIDTAPLVSPPVSRSVLLWASEQRRITDTRRIPKVVKIGPVERILKERANYQHYVDGWLFQNRQARLESFTQGWHLGAIVYAFLGASPDRLITFHEYYDTHTADEILDVLRQLFLMTCRNWYWEEREILHGVRLFALYDDWLRLNSKLNRLDTQREELGFSNYEGTLPNPGYWIAEVGMHLVFDEVTTSISHGDLHTDNFFVDETGQIWLIDFEQTGPGHALRDFLELEADIKLRLLGTHSLPELESLEMALLSGSRLDTILLPSATVAADEDLFKAFLVIAGVRHLAHISTRITALPEYLTALLFETVFVASLNRLGPLVQGRALFSGALLARHLLARGDQPAAAVTLSTLFAQHPADPQERQATQQQTRQQKKTYLMACYRAMRLQQAQYAGLAQGDRPPDVNAGLATFV